MTDASDMVYINEPMMVDVGAWDIRRAGFLNALDGLLRAVAARAPVLQFASFAHRARAAARSIFDVASAAMLTLVGWHLRRDLGT